MIFLSSEKSLLKEKIELSQSISRYFAIRSIVCRCNIVSGYIHYPQILHVICPRNIFWWLRDVYNLRRCIPGMTFRLLLRKATEIQNVQ